MWEFITHERRAAIAPFLAQYAAVRAAEGRGGDDAEYYFSLPNRNTPEWRMRRRSSAAALEVLHQRFLKRSPEEVRVLDVGAGNCWFTRLLAERGFAATALDMFIDARDGLRAGAHYLALPGIAFRRVAAHFDELPFGASSFDAIVFNASLHYSSDPLATLREALRVLTRDGLILVIDSPLFHHREAGERMRAEQRVYIQHYVGNADASSTSSYLLADDLPRWERELGVRVQEERVHAGLRQMLRRMKTRLVARREPASMPMLVITRK